MAPWQIAFGLSIVFVACAFFYLSSELSYLGRYWPDIIARYGLHLVLFVASSVFVVFFALYAVARKLSLGDIGSRVALLDRSYREGKGGDPELSEALKREDEGRYES